LLALEDYDKNGTIKKMEKYLILLLCLSGFCQEKDWKTKYDEISEYNENGYTWVANKLLENGKEVYKYGFVDGNGNKITEIKYDSAGNFFEKRVGVSIGEKSGFIDANRQLIVPLIYDDVTHFQNGFACVKLNEKFGFIDDTGVEIIKPKYDHYFEFNEQGIASVANIVGTNGNLNINKYGLINKSVPIEYDGIGIFYDYKEPTIAIIKNESKSGIVNAKGEILIPLKYDDIDIYYGLQMQGMVKVYLNGRQ
jgi:hypothetical protein